VVWLGFVVSAAVIPQRLACMVAAMTRPKLNDEELAALDIPEGCLCEHADEHGPCLPWLDSGTSVREKENWRVVTDSDEAYKAHAHADTIPFIIAATSSAFASPTISYRGERRVCVLCVCRALQRENHRLTEDNESLENEADEAQNKAEDAEIRADDMAAALESLEARADDMAATLEIFERKALDLCLSLRRAGDTKQAQLWADLEREAAEALG